MDKLFIIPLVMLTVSSYTDIKYRKIKNFITYPMIISGLAAGFFYAGVGGLIDAFVGMLMAGIIFAVIPGFSSGGGDIKLAAGCGAWLKGFYPIIQFVFFSMLFVFTAVVVKTVLKKGPRFLLARLKDEIRELAVACMILNTKTLTAGGYSHTPRKSAYGSVPMAPFMLAAYLITLLV